MKKSSTGLNENIAGLLCYLLGWVSGLIFFLVEKKSNFVRFHAMQSIIVFGGLMLLSFLCGFVPGFGCIVGGLLAALGLILWIVLMIKAFGNDKFKLPVVGDIAEKQAKTF